MEVSVKKRWMKIAVLVSLVLMLAVNALANLLPLNGVNTGEVSAQYDNLFTPAPYTFSIWGMIYLMLTVYTVFQLLPVHTEGNTLAQKRLLHLGWVFVLTSWVNAGWIFAWHYRLLLLTMVLMLALLGLLMRAGWLLRQPHCDPKEELALRIPFNLYFGWITVATIANAAALLVSLQWNGFGLSPTFWTVAILVVGVAIASVTMYRIRSVAYGLVAVWAYVGILVRHTDARWYHGAYPVIVITLVISLAALLAMVILAGIHMRKVAACKINA